MVFAEFFKPMILARMENPETRRENQRQYMHYLEDVANFYLKWFHTSSELKDEFKKPRNITRWYYEGSETYRNMPGRRHRDFSLDENAPWTYNHRY